MRKTPKLRSPENAERVCALLAEGQSLSQIAKVLRISSVGSITDWMRDDAEFAVNYARAREAGCERMADDLIALSNVDCTVNGEPNNALVQQARLRVDTLKWVLSKRFPRQYGDCVTQEIVGDAARPVITRLELVPVEPVVRAPRAQALETGGGRLIHLAAETEAKRK